MGDPYGEQLLSMGHSLGQAPINTQPLSVIHMHEQSGKVNHIVPSFLQCGESGTASQKVYF